MDAISVLGRAWTIRIKSAVSEVFIERKRV